MSRFDLLRKLDSENEFLLIEVYKDPAAPDAHKQTKHYQQWRESVESLMAKPRAATRYTTLFPSAKEWDVQQKASDISVSTYANAYPWGAIPYHFSGTASTGFAKGGLMAVLVNVHVKTELVDEFVALTIENCRCSTRESGVHRFDLLQNNEEPSNFVLVEVYNSEDAPAAHKATAHYRKWADGVASMMAAPR